MQLLPALTSDPTVIKREQRAGAHLPYARHLDDVTIETRDGLLLQTVRLSGFLFETADSDELNYRAELRDAMLRTIGNSHFAIYHHMVRRKAAASVDATFPDAFSAGLDTSWQARLAARQMYVNDLFLTIVRRPLQGRMGMTDKLRSLLRSNEEAATTIAANKRALDAAREALLASLGDRKSVV